MKKLLTELFERYHKDVYRYLYSLTHDTPLSEDLTSEVFLEVVKSIHSFRGEADVKTWLFVIARRRWFAWLRQKRQQPPTVSLQALLELAVPEDRDEATGEIAHRAWELLALESAPAQEIIRMRLAGYTYQEIAAKHKISESSARVIFFRAKSKIKEQLEKEGYIYG